MSSITNCHFSFTMPSVKLFPRNLIEASRWATWTMLQRVWSSLHRVKGWCIDERIQDQLFIYFNRHVTSSWSENCFGIRKFSIKTAVFECSIFRRRYFAWKITLFRCRQLQIPASQFSIQLRRWYPVLRGSRRSCRSRDLTLYRIKFSRKSTTDVPRETCTRDISYFIN